MGAGFIRRFGYNPGNEVITQIEGVVIISLPPPGSIQGVDTGVACIVAEFSDMTYAVAVDSSGAVTTSCRPQEVTSSQDLINKFGGFDETIGDFGLSEGNGFVSLRNKRYSRLICAPVNLSSNNGTRYVRQLPLCAAQANPLPVVPVSGGVLAAGREFRSSSNGRLRVAGRVSFTSFDPIVTGVGGATTNAGAAATQNFVVSAGIDFTAVSRPDGSLGIKKGDIIVIGNNNAGALQPLPSGGNLGAGTYRVAADAASATTIALEQLQGGNFAFVTATTIPFRIHVSSDADSAPVIVIGNSVPGGYAAADVGGYQIPARPLTNFSGALTDGSWTASAVLNPATVPPALTGSSWDPLSGLLGIVHPSALAYVALVQQPNTPAGASVDALYSTAFDATISDLAPVAEINVIWASRTSSSIRSKVKSNALDASSRSRGRMGIVRPSLSTQSTTNAVATTDPGVGANRDQRVIYTWPGEQTSVPEAVNLRLKTADGKTTIDGVLDVGFDSRLASIISNLPPERNPGQGASPVPELMATVLGIQRGVSRLEMNDYITLRRNGVAALRIDRKIGPILQSGITTSLISGQKNISRQRMADFVEDSLADRLVDISKLPLTDANKDNAVAEAVAFGEELVSRNNPAQQRLKSYSVDDKSGNTEDTEAQGIFVIIFKGRTVPTGDFIVIQSEIGENVITTAQIPG